MYRVALQMNLPRREGESDKEYDKRRKTLVWTRHNRGWEMSYKDGKVYMRPNKDAETKSCECDLDEYIETL